MNYSKVYLSIVIASFVVTLFIMGNVMGLETTWLGIYNPEGTIQKETKNEYSKIFFTKKKCEAWTQEKREKNQKGIYVCGENCKFIGTGLIDCDKLFEY